MSDMNSINIDFRWFKDRKLKLEKILRYNIYNPMFYQSSVYFHSIKLYYLLKEALPVVKRSFIKFNEEKALVMALVHDDPEIIMFLLRFWA